MLESEWVHTRSLPKIEALEDSHPTPVFIGTTPAQRNPTPADNNQIPVVKEPVRCSPTKTVRLLAKKRVSILAS